jgi:hypothetical protein
MIFQELAEGAVKKYSETPVWVTVCYVTMEAQQH